MKTLIHARSLTVLLAAMLGGPLSAKPAQAACLVEFRVYLNGQFILLTSFGDNGYTNKDGLWDHLKKLPLRTPDDAGYNRGITPAERAKRTRDRVQRARTLS